MAQKKTTQQMFGKNKFSEPSVPKKTANVRKQVAESKMDATALKELKAKHQANIETCNLYWRKHLEVKEQEVNAMRHSQEKLLTDMRAQVAEVADLRKQLADSEEKASAFRVYMDGSTTELSAVFAKKMEEATAENKALLTAKDRQISELTAELTSLREPSTLPPPKKDDYASRLKQSGGDTIMEVNQHWTKRWEQREKALTAEKKLMQDGYELTIKKLSSEVEDLQKFLEVEKAEASTPQRSSANKDVSALKSVADVKKLWTNRWYQREKATTAHIKQLQREHELKNQQLSAEVSKLQKALKKSDAKAPKQPAPEADLSDKREEAKVKQLQEEHRLKMAELQAKVASLQEALTSQEAQTTSLRGQLEEKAGRVSEMENTIADSDRKLTERLAAQEKDMAAKRETLCKRHEKRFNLLQQEVNLLRKSQEVDVKKHLEAECKRLRETVVSLEETLSEWEARWDAKEEKTREDLRLLALQRDEAVTAAESQTEAVTAAKSQTEAVTAAKSQMEARLSEAEAEWTERLQALEQQLRDEALVKEESLILMEEAIREAGEAQKSWSAKEEEWLEAARRSKLDTGALMDRIVNLTNLSKMTVQEKREAARAEKKAAEKRAKEAKKRFKEMRKRGELKEGDYFVVLRGLCSS